MNIFSLTLYDLLKGTRVRPTMQFLDESQSWSRERLHELKGEKLDKLLAEVVKKVPYYQKFESSEFEVKRFEKWPIIDREMVMEAGDALFSDNLNPN